MISINSSAISQISHCRYIIVTAWCKPQTLCPCQLSLVLGKWKWLQDHKLNILCQPENWWTTQTSCRISDNDDMNIKLFMWGPALTICTCNCIYSSCPEGHMHSKLDQNVSRTFRGDVKSTNFPNEYMYNTSNVYVNFDPKMSHIRIYELYAQLW